MSGLFIAFREEKAKTRDNNKKRRNVTRHLCPLYPNCLFSVVQQSVFQHHLFKDLCPLYPNCVLSVVQQSNETNTKANSPSWVLSILRHHWKIIMTLESSWLTYMTAQEVRRVWKGESGSFFSFLLLFDSIPPSGLPLLQASESLNASIR